MNNTNKGIVLVVIAVAVASALIVTKNMTSDRRSDSDTVVTTPGKIGRADSIELSGETYFPDSIAMREDGTLFVSSMWTGQIDMIPGGESTPTSFVPPEAEGRTALGLLVDEDGGRLWACYWDFQGFMTIPAQLKAFDLDTGEFLVAHDYPTGSICNDLTMDGDGNIYTTESFTHRVFRLPAGGDSLEVWSDDSTWAAEWQEGWTLNGIAWNGENSLYVSRTDNDGIYRVAIESDGSAGAVEQITVADDRTGMGYDGIVALDADTILVTEYGTGRLTKINVTDTTGAKEEIKTNLNFPTNAVIAGRGVWVVESQIDHLLYADSAGSPEYPFHLVYVPLAQ